MLGASCSTSSAPASPLLPLSIFRLPTIVGRERRRLHARGGDLLDVLPARALHAGRRRGSGTRAIRSGVGYLLVACTIIVSAGASQALRRALRRPQRAPRGPRAADARPALLHAGVAARHVSRRPRARLRARGHRSRLRVHPRHDRRPHGHHRRRGRARFGPDQHVAADRRRRRRRPARDRVHEPDERAVARERARQPTWRSPTGSPARSWWER